MCRFASSSALRRSGQEHSDMYVFLALSRSRPDTEQVLLDLKILLARASNL